MLSGYESCDTSTGRRDLDAFLGPFVAAQGSLSRLVLPDTSATPTGIIRQITTIAHLRELHLHLQLSAPEELEELVVLLTDGCPFIQHLSLIMRHRMNALGGGRKMPFNALRPLLRYTHLKNLSLSWYYSFHIHQDHVEAMGKASRHLEVFRMNWRGAPEHGIPLSLLSVFAQAFSPSLTTIDTTTRVEQDLPGSTPRFPSLKLLYLGYSAIPSSRASAVGHFLASVCPPGVSVELLPDLTTTPEQRDAINTVVAVVKSTHERELGNLDITQDGPGSA